MGVLIGWRACTQRQAFGELVQVVRDTGVPLSQLAGALVAMATGDQAIDGPAADVAAQRWGDLHAECGSGRIRPAETSPAQPE